MNTIERVMRVMTHVNIGCALGMVAWVASSGMLVVGGNWKVPPPRVPAPAMEPRLQTQPTGEPCCFRSAGPRDADRRLLQVERAEIRLLARAGTGGAS